MLSSYLIRVIGIANLRLEQAIILFFLIFLCTNFIMSKRFEGGASKGKRKKIKNQGCELG